MIGNLKSESDLARFIRKEVQKPDVVRVPAVAPIALVKVESEGPVTDVDFPNPPGDRTLAIQEEGGLKVLVCRLGGVWTAI